MNMKRKNELKRTIEKARAELRKIEETESAKVNKALVGRYFKYLNRYSSDNSWWLYVTVTGLSEGGQPLSWNFQKDCYGKIEVESDMFRPSLAAGYIEITAGDFWEAYEDILSELNARKKE